MSAANGYKPSPLGYGGSPAGVRNSPFRRPESPASPSPAAHRVTTPQTSPTKQSSASFAHQRLASTCASSPPVSPRAGSATTPRFGGSSGYSNNDNNNKTPSTEQLRSPAPISRSGGTTPTMVPQPNTNGNALSQLQPSQVRTLRDGFQILDRNSDGVVTREDVAEMLEQLGLPAGPSDLAKFFPPSAPQTMTLPVFLNSIATSLAAMSPSTELLSAFSAFDDDDSGQIDVAELRDALLNTAPEPGERCLTPAEVDRIVSGYSGRRAFSKSSVMMMGQNGGGVGMGGFGGGGAGKRGEVFRYQEFVQSIVGGGKGDGNGEGNDGSED